MKEVFMEQREAEQNGVDHTRERQEADLIHQVKVDRVSISNAVMCAVKMVQEGIMNPLEALVRLKAHQKFIDDTYDQIKRYALDEAGKYPEKEFQYMGCEIKKQEAGTKYDYVGTGYSKYLEAKEKVKKLEALMKSAIDNEVYDSEGERIKAPVKSSTSTLAVTIL